MDWDTALDLFLLEHQANGRSPKTISWHRHVLAKFATWGLDQDKRGPADLKPADLTAWTAWLRTRPSARGGTLKPGAVWSYACSVKAFLAWCLDQDLVDKNPATKVKIKQARPAPRPFTDQELAALWKAVAQEPARKGVWDRAILAFLIDTGCRAGEVCGIDPADFLWNQNMVLVTGKGDRERSVAFSPKTGVLLRKWDAVRHKDCPAFFQTHRRERWTPNGLLHWVYRLAARAGVQDAHPHRFRATFATKASATGNLFAVQAQLGHQSLEMTRRYAAVTSQTLRDNHDLVSPMGTVLNRKARP